MATKISKAGRYVRTPEIKDKNRKASLGHRATEQQKNKVSNFMKEWHQTHPHPLKGKKHSEVTKQKMAQSKEGAKNYNWKGGITLAVRTFRKSRQYQQWRRLVLKRDKYICQDCKGAQDLIAHHIFAVKTHPQLRLNIDNGKTLCVDCHKKTENYGNRKAS